MKNNVKYLITCRQFNIKNYYYIIKTQFRNRSNTATDIYPIFAIIFFVLFVVFCLYEYFCPNFIKKIHCYKYFFVFSRPSVAVSIFMNS